MPKPRRKQSSKLDSRFPGRGGAQGRGGGAAGRGPGAQTTAPKVEMSARAEARVRRALEAVSLDARSSSTSDDAAARAASDPPRPAVAASDLSRQKLARTYDELIAQGFAPGDVRDALAAVVSNAPNADAVSLDASLDWLCFHLPTERLPRRYQGDVRTAADVASVADITVVNLAEERRPGIDDGGGGAEAKAEAEEAAAAAEAARLADRARAAEAARVAAAAAAELSRRREAEETARANREWIMRRYDDDGRGTDEDWDASLLRPTTTAPRTTASRTLVSTRRRSSAARSSVDGAARTTRTPPRTCVGCGANGTRRGGRRRRRRPRGISRRKRRRGRLCEPSPRNSRGTG